MPSQRHERIAQLANKMAADEGLAIAAPLTGHDVQLIFRAWQADYAARVVSGGVKKNARNAWRKPAEATHAA